MKIGIIGFGAIAKKVYLPLYLENENISEVHVCGRNKILLEKKLYQYNFNLYDDFELFLSNIDCLMVHSATISHYDYIKFALKQHIPVYVDKPLSDKIKKSKELIALAKKTNTLLFVGYNRRFAPLYKKLKTMDLNIKKIYYEKHRSQLTLNENYTTAIIDDFIHLIDTVNDLNDHKINLTKTQITTSDNNELVSLNVQLDGADTDNILYTSRGKGNDYEKVTLYTDNQIIIINDMRTFTILKNNVKTVVTANQRLSDSVIRGFEEALKVFFSMVKNNQFTSLEQMTSEIICQDIIKHIKTTK